MTDTATPGSTVPKRKPGSLFIPSTYRLNPIMRMICMRLSMNNPKNPSMSLRVNHFMRAFP